MSSKLEEEEEPISDQAMLDEIRALKDEVQSLRTRLEEAEEIKRAISEGDLDALVLLGREGKLIFTLDSADSAYRVLVETMNEGTATLGYDGTILYCNYQFAKLLKIPPEAIVGTSIYRFIAPEDEIIFKALLKQEKGKSEIDLRAEGGTSLPVYLSISSLQSKGSPNAWCLVITDLTEQKKNEEILTDERLARSIIQQAAGAVVVCDASGKIIRFSNATPKLCGCNPMFQNFEDLIDVRFSEGANAGKSILPVSSALKGSTLLGEEVTFELKSQKFYLLLNSGPLKNADGKIIGCVVTLTDITERRKTEKELQNTYARLQTFFDHKIDGIGIVLGNVDGDVLEANDYYLRILGFSREELEAGVVRWSDVTPPKWRLVDEMAIAELQKHGFSTPHEKEYIRRDGSCASVLIIDAIFPGNHGEILAFVLDITERKRTEEALRESEEISRQRLAEIENLYRYAPVGLCELDRELRYVRINERMAEINGFSADTHIGKRIRDVVPQLADATEPEMLRILETGETRLNIEIVGETLSQPGVKRSWLEQWVPITDAQGLITGLNIVVEEITKRKQAEEFLRYHASLVNNISEAVVSTDTSFNILSWNQAAEKMYGWQSGEVLGKPSTLYLKTEYLDNTTQEDVVRQLSEKGFWKGEVIHRRKDGTPVYISASISILKNNFGENTGVIAVNRDITERKEAEEKLQQALNKAEEGDRLLAALMENVPEGITIADTFGQLRMVSRRGEELLGGAHASKSVDEVAAQWMIYQPDGTTPMAIEDIPLVRAVQKGEVIRDVELVQVNTRGEKLSLLCNAAPIRDAVGNITGGIVAWHDITDRKRAEEALKKAHDSLEERVKERTSELKEAYELLMENEIRLNEAQKIAHLGSWDWNIITDEVHWSDETYRIFGLGSLQFDETYDSFLNYVHPDDRDYVHNAAKKALNGEPYSIDYRITSRNGEERIVHSQGEIIFDEKRTPVRIRGIVQDITERKRMEDALRQSEALLSAFLEQLPLGIGLADTQGCWLVINSFLRRFVHGFIPSHDPENSWHWRAWRADGRLLKQSEWPSARALRGESVTPGLDFLYTFDEGREIWMHVTAVPFRNDAGEIRGVITVMQDIDEQKRTEEALEKINKTRIKEIHHRIKNNLQIISSLLSLEAERLTDTKMLEAFKESQNRVASMALIHEELYKGTGTDNLDFAAYLRKLTEDLFRSYKLENKDVSLNLDLEQVYLGMDTAIPLGIIVNELVSNSLKHAFPAGKKGEIQINVSKCETFTSMNNISGPDEDYPDKGNFHYILTVADNGKGIPEDINFQNADSLGLQLVNLLVEQIDGYIELIRDPGTEFVILFKNIEE